eukprot:TRINITY_DN6201_c0_g1_i1.p1 TRINITY_DN6201_c0_g1~~TRINITY_DN6201_c0_g1_i1.p1  ORF type:complete len:118 (+),score=6.77 TRINITY_DN6201_c0_g1_i1:72-425(+)
MNTSLSLSLVRCKHCASFSSLIFAPPGFIIEQILFSLLIITVIIPFTKPSSSTVGSTMINSSIIPKESERGMWLNLSWNFSFFKINRLSSVSTSLGIETFFKAESRAIKQGSNIFPS